MIELLAVIAIAALLVSMPLSELFANSACHATLPNDIGDFSYSTTFHPK